MVRTEPPVTGPRRVRPVRRAIKEAIRLALLPTTPIRMVPDFLIVGAQRSGTTSLYRVLAQHPAVAPVILEKGVHFFDVNYRRGFAWYRAHFPSVLYRRYVRVRHGHDPVTGEATPYYLFHPLAPKRVARHLPHARLIVLLRDPVARAYSHYHHEVDRGFERLPTFEEALAAEPERLAGEAERIVEDPRYRGFAHQHFSYVARGHYLEQLQAWHASFPRERTMVLKSEEFFAAPRPTIERILAFLGLSNWSPPPTGKLNAGRYPPIREGTRRRLVEHFSEPNRRLADYLGMELDWRS